MPIVHLGRFALLQFLRVIGTLIVMIGAMASTGQAPALSFMPHAAAMPMAFAGLALFFGAPRWLVRRWKTRP
jgi:hypothetical protein